MNRNFAFFALVMIIFSNAILYQSDDRIGEVIAASLGIVGGYIMGLIDWKKK